MSKKRTPSTSKTATTAKEKTTVSNFKSSCFTQEFALFWLDEDFDQNNMHCQQLIRGLQAIAKKIEVFNDAINCFKSISNIQKQELYLIISNPTETVLDRAQRHSQVTMIFIFSDRNLSKAGWLQRWSKIRKIFTNVDDLCKTVKQEGTKSDTEYDNLCFITSEDIKQRSVGELDQSFMYTQLIKEILLELPYDKKSIRELVTYCQDNQSKISVTLKGLDEFQTDYHQKETPIWWYTKEIFTYHLVNWALREQEFEVIIQIGFFIKDLHQHLFDLGQKQIKTRPKTFCLYRGQGMDPNRFKYLRASQGGLLAFNTFLSTSKVEDVAERFVNSAFENGAVLAIFFTISVNSSVSSAVYADIEEISYYQQMEKEVLFSMGTVFHIGAIMKRADKNREVWDVSLELTDENDKKLNALMDRIRVEIGGSTPLYRLGALMIKVGQYTKADEIYNKLLNDTTDERERGNIWYQLGFIKYHLNEPTTALNLYQNALRIQRKHLGDDHTNVASVYNNIGLAYDHLKDYKQALENYERALAIYEKKLANDPAQATCYSNIASIYNHQGDQQKALKFYQKAKAIYKNQPADNHPDLATAENNMGLAHLKLGEHREALKCFQEAVTIGTKALPPEHPDLLAYQNHFRTVTQMTNKHK